MILALERWSLSRSEIVRPESIITGPDEKVTLPPLVVRTGLWLVAVTFSVRVATSLTETPSLTVMLSVRVAVFGGGFIAVLV
ncbi:hypothetical protein D3C80_1476170 [compost metagenome]